MAVHEWHPPGGRGPDRGRIPPSLVELWENLASARLETALDTAFGGRPAGVRTDLVTIESLPGRGLCAVADRNDDLLVIGAGGRGPWKRLRGRVRRHVLAKSCCPVLTVPTPFVPWREGRRLRRASPSDFAPAGPGGRDG
ncbi:universal stress protein family protein [Kitasatospora viridis]|uniref:Universal stress protein family protein n=1 Tax=Kitasatospora viridis TaxID=281105 RepID=A0A561UCT0_9ACTN|nr:universal stress protein family protein [Kitasatospora viridis]